MSLLHDVAIAATKSAADEVLRAVRAVPPERRTWRPGGVADHAIGIVAHCAVSARFFAAVLAGAPIPYRTQADRDAAVAALEDLDQAEAALSGAVVELCSAIEGLSAERLADSMIMPWGERMPYARGTLEPALHWQYHAGQIGYIQCLMGDDEHH